MSDSSRLAIFSWNVKETNPEPMQVMEFLSKTPWDIICLQEVSEDILCRLDALKAYKIRFCYVREAIRTREDELVQIFTVLLVRGDIEIESCIGIPLPHHTPVSCLTSTFIDEATKRGIWDGTSTRKAFLSAKIRWRGKPFRVMSCRLSLVTPQNRDAEFAVLRAHIEKAYSNGLEVIICGDLNILETWPGMMVNFVLGQHNPLKLVSPKAERRSREEAFHELSLANPLAGTQTMMSRKFGVQVDHVLVPSSRTVVEAHAHASSYGSDHYPVGVVLDIKV